MSKLAIIFTMVAMSSTVYAAGTECFLTVIQTKGLEDGKIGTGTQTVLLGKDEKVLDPNSNNASLAAAGATATVVVEKQICAADGGPCFKANRMSIYVTGGDSKVAVSGLEANGIPNVFLNVGDTEVRARCMPKVGK